jgi:hypothetical protein
MKEGKLCVRGQRFYKAGLQLSKAPKCFHSNHKQPSAPRSTNFEQLLVNNLDHVGSDDHREDTAVNDASEYRYVSTVFFRTGLSDI